MIALGIVLIGDLPDVTSSGLTTEIEIGEAEPAAGFWVELVGAVVALAGAGGAGVAALARTPSRRRGSPDAPGTPFLEALDEAPLTRRFYLLAGAVMVGAVLDLFDFFLIAFVVPDLADEWDLTFGQAAVMLLAAGVGAIGGSIVWGRARRPRRAAAPADGGHPACSRSRPARSRWRPTEAGGTSPCCACSSAPGSPAWP